jgi:hypothetical protein
MAAVVVTDSLDWKLHGFDLTSEHALTGEHDRAWSLLAQGKGLGPLRLFVVEAAGAFAVAQSVAGMRCVLQACNTVCMGWACLTQ